jgi:hypothetical protein
MDADFLLGKCCGCGIEGTAVRNIVTLPYRAPEAGKGWGCLQCGIPPDGASVVLCDECLKAQRYETIIVGYAGENNRMPYEEFMKTAQPFNHDMSKHPEATRQVSIDFVNLDDDDDYDDELIDDDYDWDDDIIAYGEDEDDDDFVDDDGFDRMGSDYADYDEPDDDEYPGADAAEMWGDG